MSTIPSVSLALVTAMANPVYVSQSPPLEEVQAEGLMLLENFVEDQFQNAHLPPDAAEIIHGHDDSVVAQVAVAHSGASNGASVQDEAVAGAHGGAPNGAPPTTVYASLPEGFTNPKMKFVGQRLKEYSKKFDTSHERFLIKLLANNVSLDNLNHNGFTELLRELFSHEVTEGCVVALFFFCSDVLIRCGRCGMKEIGKTLFTWMRQFFISRVCTWVFNKGGWERVLSSVSTIALKVVAVAALSLLVIWGATYLKSK